MDNEMIFMIVKTVLYLICMVACLVITRYAIPMFKQEVGTAKFNEIKDYVIKAVESAEIIFDGIGLGEQKKDFVFNTIKNISEQIGYEITEEQLNILIESAVKGMNDSNKIFKDGE